MAGLVRSLKTAADKTGSKLVEKFIRKSFEGAEILSRSEFGIPDANCSDYAYVSSQGCRKT